MMKINHFISHKYCLLIMGWICIVINMSCSLTLKNEKNIPAQYDYGILRAALLDTIKANDTFLLAVQLQLSRSDSINIADTLLVIIRLCELFPDVKGLGGYLFLYPKEREKGVAYIVQDKATISMLYYIHYYLVGYFSHIDPPNRSY